MRQCDYVLVSGDLCSGVWAYRAAQVEKKCLIVEKRNHLGRNMYCEDVEGIYVHKYGTHIFRTSNRKVWDFISSLTEFNRYTNSPVANYEEEVYSTPFNMNTFSKMWGISTPEQAKAKIEEQQVSTTGEPKDLEEQAIRLIGTGIYERLVKGYTEKQWGRDYKELPTFIIKRLPVRYIYDNNYFNDLYQGIPISGYSVIIDKLFEGYDVGLSVDYLANRKHYDSPGETVVYTEMIDAYFGYQCGRLECRSLWFETEVVGTDNYQGVAVVSCTDRETSYTRVIEYKHFEFRTQPKSMITREYPSDWEEGMESYYPVNDEKSQELYSRYTELAGEVPYVIFGGRLGEYRYYDMDKVIEPTLAVAKKEFGK